MVGQVNADRAGQLWPPAFEDAHVHPAVPGCQGQAQHGGGWLAGEAGGPDQDQCGGALFGGQLEASQGAVVGLGQPHHDGLAAAGVERLAGGPAGMGGARRVNAEQAIEADAHACQGRRVELAGWRDADRPLSFGDVPEQGEDQAKLPHPGVRDEHFGQCPDRPAPSGQDGVQGSMACANARRGRRQAVCPPDQMCH